jgi:hypothetical protein
MGTVVKGVKETRCGFIVIKTKKVVDAGEEPLLMANK